MRPIPTGATAPIGAYLKYPGSRLLLSCSACSWSKAYRPEAVIARLRQLRGGGHDTPLADLTRRVGWNCPRCSRMRWRFELAWPDDLDPREVRRLANQIRN